MINLLCQLSLTAIITQKLGDRFSSPAYKLRENMQMQQALELSVIHLDLNT